VRILLLSQFYPPIAGGEERHVRNLAAALAARRHHVAVATLSVPETSDYQRDGEVDIYRVRGTMQRFPGLFAENERRHAPPFPDPELVAGLNRIVAKVKPDVVHAHNWLLASFTPIKAWQRLPLVVTLHDYGLICAKKNLMHNGKGCTGPNLPKCWTCAGHHYGGAKGAVTLLGNYGSGYVARKAVNKFIAVSHAVARLNKLAERGLAYEVITNFIPNDVATLSSDVDSCISQLPDEYILFAGDLTHLKGVDVLLNAYARLQDAPPLVLIGRRCPDTPTEFPPNVHVFGIWSHDAIMHAWRRSLFGVVPSVWSDPCPKVVMEAMASGKAVIASNIGGIPDMVDGEKTGLLVSPDNVDELAEALRRLLANRNLIAQMGKAGLARVESHKAAQIVTRIERVYENVTTPYAMQ
jgi:glycosyltransferase involved in cell wall biosynthesis